MLPEILEALQRIREENNFTSAAVTTFSETTASQVSSSVKVKISEDSRQLHLFIKFLDPSQRGTDFYDDSLLYFRNEIVFYREIASRFLALSDDDGASTTSPCLAKCYATAGGQGEEQLPPFIVLEDLVAGGYAALDARQLLTAACAGVLMKRLGQLHAQSIALRSRDPHVLSEATGRLQETVFKEDKRRVFTSAMHDAYRLAKRSFPADSVYVDKLGGFVLDVFDRLSRLAGGEDEEDGDCDKVVTHGDLWLNNVLCKRDPETGLICDPVFVDFQGCRYSSPVHDLMLLLLAGLGRDELERHGERLVLCYRHSLHETLARLGLPRGDPPARWPTASQLVRHSPLALGLALAGLPVFLRDEGDRGARRPSPASLQAVLRRLAEEKTMRCKSRMLELVIYAADHGYI